MLDEVKWREAVFKAIDGNQEAIFDALLDIADNNSLESLLIHDLHRPYEYRLIHQKIHTIPMIKKFMAKGANFHGLMSKGNSIYAYLLGGHLCRYSPEERKKIIDNTIALVGFLKDELKIIPKPETVLKDLSKIISNGDHDIDLLAAVYDFPHNDWQTIENKHWYEDIFQYIASRLVWGDPFFLKTFQFLHNKGIPLASLKNEDQGNLLHELFKYGYYEALQRKYFRGFNITSDYFGDMIKLLVQIGVDPNAKDNEGKTPFDWAKYYDEHAEKHEWATIFNGPVNKDVKFKLDIVPVPPHVSPAVVSFSRPSSSSVSLEPAHVKNALTK